MLIPQRYPSRTVFAAAQVQALLDEERARTVAAEERYEHAQQHLRKQDILLAAYKMLGRARGFTEQDARDCWKEAGYGGL